MGHYFRYFADAAFPEWGTRKSMDRGGRRPVHSFLDLDGLFPQHPGRFRSMAKSWLGRDHLLGSNGRHRSYALRGGQGGWREQAADDMAYIASRNSKHHHLAFYTEAGPSARCRLRSNLYFVQHPGVPGCRHFGHLGISNRLAAIEFQLGFGSRIVQVSHWTDTGARS